jgi:sRNA-binding regulator protein Hfq
VISEGDEFVYLLNGETLKSVVKSIELNRVFISDYSGNEQIGILI